VNDSVNSPPSLDVLGALLKRWKTIALFVFVGSVGGLAVGFLTPRWYEATLTVVPSTRSQSQLQAALASKLPDALDPTSTDSQRILAVLNSVSVADRVIDRFNLGATYETEFREHTREQLHKHCKASAEKKSGVVILRCEDKDPNRAMQMAGYFGEVGNEVFRRVSSTSAQEESRFLEAQVAKARKDVDDASRKLREFQEKYKVIDLPEQSKAVISAMASVKGELMTKQLSIQYLTSFSSASESSVVQLRQQIQILEDQLNELETNRAPNDGKGWAPPKPAPSAGSGTQPDFFPEAASVPNLRFELEQLLRQQKIYETVFFLMTQRHEMAKVDAARDTSTFQILDYPTLPTYKSRPKKAKIALIGMLAGGMVGALVVLGPLWLRRRRFNVA
jgi:capsule polysaccharide export protein KpsE/RkpR